MTIEEALSAIKNAVYGKDVRQAMHDGILQAEGGAGTVAKEAEKSAKKAEASAKKSEIASRAIEGKADQAVTMARSANSKSDSTQLQLNEIVINGDSSVEAAQARVDIENIAHDTLKARLDKEQQEVTAQLAHEALKRTIANDYIEYGKIDISKYAPDFPKAPPFELYRDFDGKIKHTFDFDENLKYTDKIYLDFNNGAIANDGLTESTPVRYLSDALTKAEALSTDSVEIVLMNKWLVANLSTQDPLTQKFDINKNITLSSIHEGGTFITSGNHGGVYTWTNDNGVYSTTRSRVEYVADYKFKDFKGLPLVYNMVGTLSECQSNAGTWYTDGSTVWVNRLDGSIPDEDIGLGFTQNTKMYFTLYGYKFALDNVHFWIKQLSYGFDALNIGGTSRSKLYARNTSARFSYKRNGIAVSNIGETYLFNSFTSENGADGFNYHGGTHMLVFEYDCYSYGNGLVDSNRGNCTTAHGGINIIRVNTVGHDTAGPVLADVNGCYSIIFDTTMYDSLRQDEGATKAAFYFDKASAPTEAIGKAVLINCGGGGNDTFSINSDGLIDISVKNFKGNNIPKALQLNVLD